MREIIMSLAREYGLSNAGVMAEIERTLSAALSRWYRLDVMVFFQKDYQLKAVTYIKNSGVIMQKPIEFAKMKGRHFLERCIEESLMRAAVLRATRRYKAYEKQLRWGLITGRNPDGSQRVEVEIVPGEVITAVCPVNRLGVHERESRELGLHQRRAFHVRSIEPVAVNGTARLKVVLDRVSKTLVENLLRERLGMTDRELKIRCLARFVGQKSIVFTTKPFPREAILAVDRELKERIQVRFVKNIMPLESC